MKTLIVDDEAPARQRLRHLLGEIPGCEVCDEAGNGVEAVEKCARFRPDVVLMDIRMPEMDGLEAARHLLNMEHPPAVIFTTAFGEHALAAFDAHAVDYLLKPIRLERLADALHRAQRLTRARMERIGERDGAPRERICARVRGDLVLVPVADIRYFQADNKYVVVHYPGGKVLIEESLKSIEREFGDRLLRIHRNALVNRDYLAGVEKPAYGQYRVRLEGTDETLEVSRRHVAEVREWFRNSRR